MTEPTGAPAGRAQRAARPSMLIALLGIFFVGLNLRPAIISVAFVIPDIRSDLALGATAAGLLTTVPLLAFVLLSMRAPGWGRRFGLARTILAALVILMVGFAIRLVPSATALFIGMAVVGVAITIGNVLLPAFIKARYPDKGGILMGVYTVSLYAGPALASGLTLPIARATGSWRIALLSWGILAVIALPLWLPQVGRVKLRPGTPAAKVKFTDNGGASGVAEGAGEEAADASGAASSAKAAPPAIAMSSMLRSPLAWAVSVYFAVLSVLFYTVNAWLPTMFLEQGRGENAGGEMLTVVNLVAIPCALAVSIFVHRTRSQVWATSIGSVGLGVGLAGMYFAPAHLGMAFAVFFGIGHGTATGIAFSLAMLRTRTVAGTAGLGALSQTAGYTCSAIGPVGAGALHDVLSGGGVAQPWSVVMAGLVALVVLQFLAGLWAGRDRYLEDALSS
ncbi:MFS transporter [Corynebacterium urealyticum]|uniref:MFS transporter n=1 Tax=Corynebacterium urealyticum TaxID=43771 RepID=UPI0002B3F9C4|nr:MFS transporter [Corynebacterium urealyticum]AGE35632.1 putative permease of the major facilitator superfamily [Corynebacterium urealyticum DSM 7111]QQB07507.1 MFS transporter [Corynebacterium urealyticum]